MRHKEKKIVTWWRSRREIERDRKYILNNSGWKLPEPEKPFFPEKNGHPDPWVLEDPK